MSQETELISNFRMEPCNSSRDRFLDLFSDIRGIWNLACKRQIFEQFKGFSNLESPTPISPPKGTSLSLWSRSTFLSKLRKTTKLILLHVILTKSWLISSYNAAISSIFISGNCSEIFRKMNKEWILKNHIQFKHLQLFLCSLRSFLVFEHCNKYIAHLV